jgi:hypothetical protein
MDLQLEIAAHGIDLEFMKATFDQMDALTPTLPAEEKIAHLGKFVVMLQKFAEKMAALGSLSIPFGVSNSKFVARKARKAASDSPSTPSCVSSSDCRMQAASQNAGCESAAALAASPATTIKNNQDFHD